MGNRINLGDIEARLGNQVRLAQFDEQDVEASAAAAQFESGNESRTASLAFIALCVGAFLAVGGGTYFMFGGGDEGGEMVAMAEEEGAEAKYVSKVDAKCAKGWGDVRENRDQLHCYFTTDIARLCDTQERSHLLRVVDRYHRGANRYAAAQAREGVKMISNQGKMAQVGMAGAMATQGDLSPEEQVERISKAANLANDVKSGYNENMMQIRNEKSFADLAKVLKSLIILGYLTPDDFGGKKPDWLATALNEIEFSEPSPCGQA